MARTEYTITDPETGRSFGTSNPHEAEAFSHEGFFVTAVTGGAA